ncbi:MAG: HAD family hydrolase [Magnetospirillum gryphiswaldense]|nr:HAD family hydrolase [Magnetospirillum gryphiswaldense]
MSLVAFDGDDTLWHNEPLFWATQDRFKQLLAPYCPPGHLAERLYRTEVANLSLFGYGIKGFALSMIETAIEVSDGQVPTAMIAELIERAKHMLAHPVHLLDGVAEAARAVKDAGHKIMVITKGDLLDQEAKLARSGLAEMFDAVEVVSEKDEALYRRLFAQHGVGEGDCVMVGNSVRSDILPVLAAGGWAVHIPYAGPVWAHEAAEPPVDHPRYMRLDSMASLPDWLAKM